MNIKKKIAVWCSLFALLVALVPPSSARASTTETTGDDMKYPDIESFVHGMGYSDFVSNEGSLYLAFLNDSNFAIIEFVGIEGLDYTAYYTPSYKSDTSMVVTGVNSLDGKVFEYVYLSPTEASKNNNFSCRYGDYYPDHETSYYLGSYCQAFELYSWSDKYYDFQYLVYSDFDVYLHEGNSKYFYKEGDLVFECTKEGVFNFPVWCSYAGLNCLASTNESPTKIPYSYNSYWHIVRKTNEGKWLLTTIGSNLGQAKMSLRLTEDNSKMMIYEFSGDDTVSVNVRQYEYDLDGWKFRKYDTYSYSDFTSGILTLEAGTGVDSTRMVAYTSTPIYSYDGLSVSFPMSSEYYEVEMPDIPEHEPTPTPTTSPQGGNGGGSMITYKPALNGEVIADSLNMRPEPTTSVDAIASFIRTWSLVLHGYVQTNEGVWYYCTAERDGQQFTGYVMAQYVEIVSEGIGDGGESTLDDTLVQAITELESMATFVARVPLVVGIIFSFMPAWCLGLFGVAFIFILLGAIKGK